MFGAGGNSTGRPGPDMAPPGVSGKSPIARLFRIDGSIGVRNNLSGTPIASPDNISEYREGLRGSGTQDEQMMVAEGDGQWRRSRLEVAEPKLTAAASWLETATPPAFPLAPPLPASARYEIIRPARNVKPLFDPEQAADAR